MDDHHDGIGEVRVECLEDEKDNNLTFVKITFFDMGEGFSSLLPLFEDDSAQILIGNASSGCNLWGSDDGFKLRMRPEREWTEFSNQSVIGRMVTFHAVEASFHECFLEMHFEFFAGRPSDFRLARRTRRASIPNFVNDSNSDINLDPVNAVARFTRNLKCSDSYGEAKISGRDCTTSGSQESDCFYSDALMVGNTYSLHFNSDVSQKVRVEIWEDDLYFDDRCNYQLRTIKSGENAIKIQIPDLTDCGDFASSPEYYIKIIGTGCDMWQTGKFRSTWGNEVDEKYVNIQVPSSLSYGKSTTGKITNYEECSINATSNVEFTCDDCSVTGKSSVHVVMRATNFNPFEET